MKTSLFVSADYPASASSRPVYKERGHIFTVEIHVRIHERRYAGLPTCIRLIYSTSETVNEHDAERRWGEPGESLEKGTIHVNTRGREQERRKQKIEIESNREDSMFPSSLFLDILLSPSLSFQNSFALMNF